MELGLQGSRRPLADVRARANARGRDGGVREELAAGRRTIKKPLPGSEALLQEIDERLGPDRSPLLIAVDGEDGVGKSSLASWLAWQLGVPTVHLDLFVIQDRHPLQWRTGDLQRAVATRLDPHGTAPGRPLVIEGVMLLAALSGIGRKPDYLVYLTGEGSHGLSDRLADYRARYEPLKHADKMSAGLPGVMLF